MLIGKCEYEVAHDIEIDYSAYVIYIRTHRQLDELMLAGTEGIRYEQKNRTLVWN